MTTDIYIPPHKHRVTPGCQHTHLYEAAVADGRLRRWRGAASGVWSYFPADEPVEPVVHHREWTSYRTITSTGDVIETDWDPTKPHPGLQRVAEPVVAAPTRDPKGGGYALAWLMLAALLICSAMAVWS
jgi:hypothetical protein